MARPTGSKNVLTGRTYFFNVGDQASKPSKYQVAITHTTSGHWQLISYDNGIKATKGTRVPYKVALAASGVDEEIFKELFKLKE